MASKLKVLVTKPSFPREGIDLLKQHFDVDIYSESETIPSDKLRQLSKGKDAIFLTVGDRVDDDLLKAAGPTLKCISTFSVGYDHVDIDACRKLGIKVGHTPNVLTETVAEITIGLLLAVTRRIVESNRALRNGLWTESIMPSPWMFGVDVAGSTVGIVGMGRIGLAVATRIKGFEPAHILYQDVRKVDAADKFGGTHVSMDDLLKRSDFIFACCALLPETAGIFDERAFSLMKPNAIFVNTSRGGVVKQEALCDALVKKKILGAGLDVTVPEPLPKDHILAKLDNCVITPHLGSATYGCRAKMSVLAAKNLIAALNKQPMPAQLV